MSCLVQRSKHNKVVGVLAPNGNKSESFRAINKIAFMGDSDLSLKVLYNIYSNKVEKLYESVNDTTFVYNSTREPRVYFKTPMGMLVEDIEQSIIDGHIGTFEIGVLNPNDSSFIKIGSFDTEHSSKTQAIRVGIQQGTLSPNRVLTENGDNIFEGKGRYTSDKRGTARMFKVDFQNSTGIPVKVNYNGTLEIKQQSDFLAVNKKDGTTVILHSSEISEAIKNNSDITNKPELLVSISDALTREFGNNENAQGKLSEKAYMSMLTSFLNNLGFSTTTMDKYKRAFNNRHGKDPDVTALLDLANKIVAISEGNVIADMTEEVVHLAVEAYSDENSIVGALIEVENTPEYTQWADIYRQKYSSQFGGTQLEDVVRKEILGKVIARSIQDRQFTTPEAETIWQRILNYFRSKFKPSQKTAIDRITNDIQTAFNEGDMTMFDVNRVSKDGVFYSLKEMDEKLVKSLDAVGKVINSLADVLREGGISAPRVSTRSLPKKMDEYAFIKNTKDRIDALRLSTNSLKTRIASGSVAQMDKSRSEVLQELAKLLPTYVKALREITDKEVKPSANTLADIIELLIIDIGNTAESMNQKSAERFKEIVEEEADSHNLTEEEAQKVQELFDGVMKDLTGLAKLFGTSSESSRPLLALAAKVISKMKPTVSRRTQPVVDEIADLAEKKGWLKASFQEQVLEKDKGGKLTGYWITPLLQGEYDRQRDDFKISKISEIKSISESEARKLFNSKSDEDIFETDSELNQYRKETQDWINDNTERFFVDSYYKELEDLYDLANVSQEVRDEKSQERRTIREIQKNYTDEEGRIRRELMSPEDADIFNFEMARLKKKASPLQGLQTRQGLKQKKVKDLTQQELESLPMYGTEGFSDILSPNMTIILSEVDVDTLSFDSRYALDHFNLNFARRVQFNNSSQLEVADNFIKLMEDMESAGGDVLDMLEKSGSITFTDNYYDTISGNASLVEQIEERIEDIREEDRDQMRLLLDNYKDMGMRRAEFLKTYRSSNNVFEILAENISTPEREDFKKLETDIREIRSLMTSLLKRSKVEGIETSENSIPVKTTTNEAFEAEIEAKGMKDKRLDFMLSEMTSENAEDVRDFRSYILGKMRGSKAISKSKERAFQRISETQEFKDIMDKAKNESWTQDQVAEAIVTDVYAVSKLPAYFVKRELQEYIELKKLSKEGLLKASDKIKRGEPIGEYVTVTPNYTWTTMYENKDFINPRYKKSFGGQQPKFDRYKNTEWFNSMYSCSSLLTK